MSKNLGTRSAVGTLTTDNYITPGTNLWVVRFRTQVLPSDFDFEVWHGFAQGPGGYFQTFLNDQPFGIGQNGRLNEYSPRGSAMYVVKGSEISLHWSISTGSAPKVWLYLRLPEVGNI